MASAEYTLYYWGTGNWGTEFKGRGEFIRLLFEAAQISYTENNNGSDIMASCDLANLGTGFPYPAKSPPIVTGPDGFNCSQTPALLHILGKKFGLYPDEADEAHCLALNITVADYVAEGRLAFHAVNPVGSYSTQAEETKPRIKWFVDERLSKWLGHFEHCLKETPDSGASFFFSGKLTYCDIAVFHAINSTEAQFKEEWDNLASKFPLLVAFQARMKKVPGIAAYLASDRVRPWAGDSMM